MGQLASWTERQTSRLWGQTRRAGVVTVIFVVISTGVLGAIALQIAQWLHPVLYWLTGVWLIYSSLAVRDLVAHSVAVYNALNNEDLQKARERVGMLVGRDTEHLDRQGIIRATIESVAESIVDGVTAPLFFAFIFGPIGAVVYRAINTLDSMFGYKEGRYRAFGWCSARLDDIANAIPVRLTAPVIVLSAFALRLNTTGAITILSRDRHKQSGPNSGWAEAGIAGGLGIQLGGVNRYFGKVTRKPLIGDHTTRLRLHHIRQANRIMVCTTALFFALGTAVLFLVRG